MVVLTADLFPRDNIDVVLFRTLLLYVLDVIDINVVERIIKNILAVMHVLKRKNIRTLAVNLRRLLKYGW